MNCKKRLSAVSTALALVGVMAFSGPALADTVTATYIDRPGDGIGVSPGGTATISNTAPGSPVLNPVTTYSGVFVHRLDSSSPSGIDLAPFGTDKFVSFCIDLGDSTGGLNSQHTYTIVDLDEAPDPLGDNMGPVKATDLRKLLYSALDTAGFDGQRLSDASSLTNAQANALQLAVWEVVFEKSGTYDVSGGNFRATASNSGTALGLANTYLAGIANAAGEMGGLIALTNPNIQDFIAQVPIPAAAWLFGSALVGVAALGRRCRRQENV